MGNRTDDADTVMATSKHRQRVRESAESRKEERPMSFGIHPDHPALRLAYWPSRDKAINLIRAIDENILRNYVPGVVIEQALWSSVPGDKEEREKIKGVLSSVYGSGWVVEFHNGCGERITLRNPADIRQE